MCNLQAVGNRSLHQPTVDEGMTEVTDHTSGDYRNIFPQIGNYYQFTVTLKQLSCYCFLSFFVGSIVAYSPQLSLFVLKIRIK